MPNLLNSFIKVQLGTYRQKAVIKASTFAFTDWIMRALFLLLHPSRWQNVQHVLELEAKEYL